jgi:hypothetical protein
MMCKLNLEQRALAVVPEVSFRWTDNRKLGNEQNLTSASCCSWRSVPRTKPTVAKAMPKHAPVKKAARKAKPPVTPVVETVAVELAIECAHERRRGD